MKIKIIKKESEFWLSIEGHNNALINLGKHGEIVNTALVEAAEQQEFISRSFVPKNHKVKIKEQ